MTYSHPVSYTSMRHVWKFDENDAEELFSFERERPGLFRREIILYRIQFHRYISDAKPIPIAIDIYFKNYQGPTCSTETLLLLWSISLLNRHSLSCLSVNLSALSKKTSKPVKTVVCADLVVRPAVYSDREKTLRCTRSLSTCFKFSSIQSDRCVVWWKYDVREDGDPPTEYCMSLGTI